MSEFVTNRIKNFFEYLSEAIKLTTSTISIVEEHNDFILFQNEVPDVDSIETILDLPEGQHQWLKICQRDVDVAPVPTLDLEGWIDDYNDPDKEPRVIRAREFNGIKENFSENPYRQVEFDKYINQWHNWAIKAKPEKQAQSLFHALYHLIDRVKYDEQKELVWGHGLLVWNINDRVIKYPVITQRMTIDYDNNEKAINISPEEDRQVELELNTVQDLNISKLPHLKQFWKEQLLEKYDPFSKDACLSIFKEIVNCMSPYGKVVEIDEMRSVTPLEDIKLINSWLLFVRKRQQNAIIRDIESVKNKMNDSNFHFAEGFESFFGGIPSASVIKNWTDRNEWSALLDKKIYFPLPANQEQIQILDCIEQSQGVVVLGPPGTGKSHTIANLISHFLAEGKRVLVTSQKDQALTVLYEKIPDEIRPLCMFMLSDIRFSKENLKNSVEYIIGIVNSNPHLLRKEIIEYEKQEDSIRQEIARIHNKLKDLTDSQFCHLIYKGENLTPAELAFKMKNDEEKHGWLKDEPLYTAILSQENIISIVPAPLPFTPNEFHELLEQRARIVDQITDFYYTIPPITEFLGKQDLLKIIEELHKISIVQKSIEQEFPGLIFKTDNTELINTAIGILRKAIDFYNVLEKDWQNWAKQLRLRSSVPMFQKLIKEWDVLKAQQEAILESVNKVGHFDVVTDDKVGIDIQKKFIFDAIEALKKHKSSLSFFETFKDENVIDEVISNVKSCLDVSHLCKEEWQGYLLKKICASEMEMNDISKGLDILEENVRQVKDAIQKTNPLIQISGTIKTGISFEESQRYINEAYEDLNKSSVALPFWKIFRTEDDVIVNNVLVETQKALDIYNSFQAEWQKALSNNLRNNLSNTKEIAQYVEKIDQIKEIIMQISSKINFDKTVFFDDTGKLNEIKKYILNNARKIKDGKKPYGMLDFKNKNMLRTVHVGNTYPNSTVEWNQVVLRIQLLENLEKYLELWNEITKKWSVPEIPIKCENITKEDLALLLSQFEEFNSVITLEAYVIPSLQKLFKEAFRNSGKWFQEYPLEKICNSILKWVNQKPYEFKKREFLQNIRINNTLPKSKKDFEDVLTYMDFEKVAREFIANWSSFAINIGASQIDLSAIPFKEAVRKAMLYVEQARNTFLYEKILIPKLKENLNKLLINGENLLGEKPLNSIYDYLLLLKEKMPEENERKRILKNILINGKFPKTLEEWEAICLCLTTVQIVEGIQKFTNMPPGAPEKSSKSLLQILSQVEQVIAYVNLFVEVKEALTPIIVRAEELVLDENLNKLFNTISLKKEQNSFASAKEMYNMQVSKCEKMLKKEGKHHPILKEMLNVLQDLDYSRSEFCVTKWTENHNKLSLLNELQSVYSIYSSQVEKLSKVAPVWSQSWKAQDQLDNCLLPSHYLESWEYKAFEKYLSEILDNVRKISELKSKQDSFAKELFILKKKIILIKSKLGLIEHISREQLNALNRWLVAIRKLGKGKSKYVEEKRRNVQREMQQAKDTVPVWIMPLYKVSETIPCEAGFFDIVIVDEASQSNISALLALVRGKKSIVVGDPDQISPLNVGINEQQIQQLIKEYLPDFPSGKYFDFKTSLYDLAKITFGNEGTLMLKEHFRCIPEIIQFCNQFFYNNKILPLRNPPFTQRLEPVLENVYVDSGYREELADINKPEAIAVCEKLRYLVNDLKYKGKTFGVISLTGFEQAKHIAGLVDNYLSPEQQAIIKFRCGDAYSFQGDERDIIFLSMVVARNNNIVALTSDVYRQRFNVAVSRAKDKIVLFHSVRLEDLRNHEDLRYLLLHYIQNKSFPANVLVKQGSEEELFESPFEKEVYTYLVKNGYRVIPQYKVGNRRIDLVVEGNNNSRLAIECDGDRYHTPDKWMEDQIRERQLKRLGWQISRIWGSVFYKNKDFAMKPILCRLVELGILPCQSQLQEDSNASSIRKNNS